MGLFKKEEKKFASLSDLKKANGEIRDLWKKIKNEAKKTKNASVIEEMKSIDLSIDYKAIRLQDTKDEGMNQLLLLTHFIKDALLDVQELLRKGTTYGVILALHRVKDLSLDRSIGKSQFLIKEFQTFEASVWQIIKLRELAYGEIEKLREKQDTITKTALNEKDPSMRVRYFDDIHAIDLDILRLEKDARTYDSYQASLHSEERLSEVLKNAFGHSFDKEEIQKIERVLIDFSSKKED